MKYSVLVTYRYDSYKTGSLGLFDNPAIANVKALEYLDISGKADDEPEAFEEFRDGAEAYEDSEIRVEVLSINEDYFAKPDERKEPSYVESVDTHHSGGGSMVDLIYLKSGLLLVLNDEIVAAYRNDRAFQLDEAPIGAIETFDINEPPQTSKKDSGDNIEKAVNKALNEFWIDIAASFPDCKSGDLPPAFDLALERTAIDAVEKWVELNG